jgi:uncharacterized membrane protein
MKKYFSILTGVLALGIEVSVFLSLMELPPFGRGGSDVIWGLPFFGLLIMGLAVLGLVSALRTRGGPGGGRGLVTAGLILNGLSLAVPILLLLFAIGRLLL